jgi:hypothetical protein
MQGCIAAMPEDLAEICVLAPQEHSRTLLGLRHVVFEGYCPKLAFLYHLMKCC